MTPQILNIGITQVVSLMPHRLCPLPPPPPRTSPATTHLIGRWLGPRSGLEVFWSINKYRTLTGIEPLFLGVQSVAQSLD
jgi:hypothetical protein